LPFSITCVLMTFPANALSYVGMRRTVRLTFDIPVSTVTDSFPGGSDAPEDFGTGSTIVWGVNDSPSSFCQVTVT
jgi:hypothetical protein